MAGTDHTVLDDEGAPTVDAPAPAVILVTPQLGANIGACARAMLNCNLRELRLVRPRDGWPNPEARAMAAGADAVLEEAAVFDTTADAVADLRLVFATTARQRDLRKPVVTAERAAAEIHRAASHGTRAGLLFGPERTGLLGEDLTLADKLLHIPLNPGFSSLNLAQAVLLVAWTWYRDRPGATPPEPSRAAGPRGDVSNPAPTPHPAGDPSAPRGGAAAPDPAQRPAPKEAVAALLTHLERELEAARFFKAPSKGPALLRTIHGVIVRAAPTESEVSLLHGVITALCDRRLDGRRRGEPRS